MLQVTGVAEFYWFTALSASVVHQVIGQLINPYEVSQVGRNTEMCAWVMILIKCAGQLKYCM